MNGTGPPLVTPFDDDGNVDEPALRELVGWITDRDVDFLVPCGSNSEAELLTADERARVVELVVEESDVPVLAGTGHPGYRETLQQTERAAEAGADAALVITPFYFDHGQTELEQYFSELADESPLPVYLYSVPAYTNVRLEPETVGRLAEHPNVAGMKDSSGDLTAFQQTRARTADAEFDLLVGSGSIYAAALDAGADGGILALANVAPEQSSEIRALHRAGNDEQARALNRELVELNQAITAVHGVPAVKAVMRGRGAPAGTVRRPNRPLDESASAEIEELVEQAEP